MICIDVYYNCKIVTDEHKMHFNSRLSTTAFKQLFKNLLWTNLNRCLYKLINRWARHAARPRAGQSRVLPVLLSIFSTGTVNVTNKNFNWAVCMPAVCVWSSICETFQRMISKLTVHNFHYSLCIFTLFSFTLCVSCN